MVQGGDIGSLLFNKPTTSVVVSSFSGSSQTSGITFAEDGDLISVIGSGSDTTNSNYWLNGTNTGEGAGFEVVAANATTIGITSTECLEGTWDAEAAAADTWIAIGSDRTWSFTDAGPRTTAQLFMIRTTDQSAANEWVGGFWVMVTELTDS